MRRYVLVAIVLVLLGGGAVALIASDGDDGGKAPPRAAPTPTATATPDAGYPGDLKGGNLRAEPDVPGKAEGAEQTNRAARALPPRSSWSRPRGRFGPKCRVDYSGQVWSSRNGVRPTEFVLHYTVSSNRPGWGDVYAIQSYFKNTRIGSAHFIMDFEGHCLKMVPLKQKAWTQGNANPWALSVEIIATGSESNAAWKASPLIAGRKLARLVRRVVDFYRLPLRRVNPVGCVFVPGWTDHNALECGNDHHDVTPNFPYVRFGHQLRKVR